MRDFLDCLFSLVLFALIYIGVLISSLIILRNKIKLVKKRRCELKEAKIQLRKEEIKTQVEFINKESTSGYPHDKIYDVVDWNARMKCPDDGRWVNAVVYSHEGNLFIRKSSDFYEKFKAIN